MRSNAESSPLGEEEGEVAGTAGGRLDRQGKLLSV